MIVFLDTNIVLDIALEREDFCQEASRIALFCDEEGQQAVISWHSFATIYYLLERSLSRDQALEFLKSLLGWVNIAPTGKAFALEALQNPGADLEDTLQYLCAEAAGCDVIITRNTKDFQQSKVESYTPTDFLRRFAE